MPRAPRRKPPATPPVVTLDDAAVALMQASGGDGALVEAAAAALAGAAATVNAAGGAGGAMLGTAAAAMRAAAASGVEARCAEALSEAGVLVEALMSMHDVTGREPAAPPQVTAVPEPACRGERPAAAPPCIPVDADAELLDGFVAESLEYLDAAETALLLLESEPSHREACNTVFRGFHTIKGTAAFLGLADVVELAHLAESLLGRVRDGSVPFANAVADLSLRAVDVLRAQVLIVRGAAGPGAELVLPDGYPALLDALRAADGDSAIGASAATPAAPTSPIPPATPAAPTTPAAPAAVPADPSVAARPDVEPTPEPGAAGDAWMRVRTDRLDRLIDMVGELVIAHAMIAEDTTLLAAQRLELGRKVAHMGKIVRALQDHSMSMRMLPLRPTFRKVARLVRDLSARTGKPVELVTHGEETELDRSMVELIGDPLVHMVRNAMDHGIETPAERHAAGKPAVGRLRLTAYHAGGGVVIELEDDGRGLDRQRILARATERGIIDAGRNLSEADINALIFAPGFSTAESVTAISGRGVGMDVVRRNVEALRGRIDIASRPGTGTGFTIRLPLTLAITDGMLVRVGAERYIVPMVNIHLSFRPEPSQLSTVAGRAELVRLRDELLPLVRLHRVFDVPDAIEDPSAALLVVVASGQRRFAVLVDELIAQHQVVAKPLGRGIGAVDGVSGSAILGDGRVGLILDVPQLHQLHQLHHGAAITAGAA